MDIRPFSSPIPSPRLMGVMEFIELTGKTLMKVIIDDEFTPDQVRTAGVKDSSLLRVNRQGDIELRQHNGWEVIGGLLGEFEQRVHDATGLDWA